MLAFISIKHIHICIHTLWSCWSHIYGRLAQGSFPEIHDCHNFRVIVCMSHLSKTYDSGFTILYTVHTARYILQYKTMICLISIGRICIIAIAVIYIIGGVGWKRLARYYYLFIAYSLNHVLISKWCLPCATHMCLQYIVLFYYMWSTKHTHNSSEDILFHHANGLTVELFISLLFVFHLQFVETMKCQAKNPRSVRTLFTSVSRP